MYDTNLIKPILNDSIIDGRMQQTGIPAHCSSHQG